MPIYEMTCPHGRCRERDRVVERFMWHWDDPDPQCEQCGCQMKRLVSSFNAPFTGDLSRFDVAGHETKNRHGGHWAYKVRSSRFIDKDGKTTPEKVWVDSVQKQKQFCKEEGLIDPGHLNPNIQGNSEGTVDSSRLRGSWV